MTRPYRPNPSSAPRGSKARNDAHPKQETARERKARKRAEAEQRHEEYLRSPRALHAKALQQHRTERLRGQGAA